MWKGEKKKIEKGVDRERERGYIGKCAMNETKETKAERNPHLDKKI